MFHTSQNFFSLTAENNLLYNIIFKSEHQGFIFLLLHLLQKSKKNTSCAVKKQYLLKGFTCHLTFVSQYQFHTKYWCFVYSLKIILCQRIFLLKVVQWGFSHMEQDNVFLKFVFKILVYSFHCISYFS